MRELAPAARSCNTLPEQSSLVCTNDFKRKNMLHNKTFAPEFCSLISNWFDMREQAPGANLLHDSVQEQAPSCVLKFALWERVSGASPLVCTEICFAGACFRRKLPREYWLGYLPGSMFRERVSGACFRSKLPRVY